MKKSYFPKGRSRGVRKKSSNKAKLLSAMHYHQRPGIHPTPQRIQSEQCIEVVTGGRGWVEINGSWVEVTAGALLWHIRGDHTIGRSDFQNPYRCLAVRFEDGNNRKRQVPRLTRWDDHDEVLLFTNEIVRLHTDETFDSQILLRYILSRVRFEAALFLREQLQRRLPMEIQQVVEVINRRYSEPLRLFELAQCANWSVAHLHHRCQEYLGDSPHQILLRRRLQAARELLASTNHPIKILAAMCGFPTSSAFCTHFKKATRLSPKEYRHRLLFGVNNFRRR